MTVALDAKVRTCDGLDVGTVSHAVVDPHTDKVTEFVISTRGLLGRDVLVPRAEIEWAEEDGGGLRLRLGTRDLAKLPTYHESRYGAPPPGWSPLDSYGLPRAGYVWPLWGVATRRPNEAPASAPTVLKGAIVRDVVGTVIGVVEEVENDPESGHLEGVTFRVAEARRTLFGGGGDRIRVSAAEIVEIGEQLVRLNSAREAYRRHEN